MQNNLDKPDWRLIKDHLQKEGRIEKQHLIKLIIDCNKIMSYIYKITCINLLPQKVKEMQYFYQIP